MPESFSGEPTIKKEVPVNLSILDAVQHKNKSAIANQLTLINDKLVGNKGGHFKDPEILDGEVAKLLAEVEAEGYADHIFYLGDGQHRIVVSYDKEYPDQSGVNLSQSSLEPEEDVKAKWEKLIEPPST